MTRFVLKTIYIIASLLPFVFLGIFSVLSMNWYVGWAVVAAVCTFLFRRMRFIEPRYIAVHHVHVPLWLRKKIVLISDLHLWIFKGARFLETVVQKIQKITGVDFVVIAWDLTYEPLPQDIQRLFEPLRNLTPAVYAVLGNHDVGHPWPQIAEHLRRVLHQNNVRLLENHIIDFNEFYLAWLWDWHASQDDVAVLDACDPTKPKIVIAHNPDTTLKYGVRQVELTLSWHTHGWQVRIPGLLNWAYRRILGMIGKFDDGLHHQKSGKLYISSWLWEVGIPLRLRSRPRIDVIYV